MRWVDFRLTNQCDGACRYCRLPLTAPGTPELLDTETVTRTIDGAVGVGVSALVLMGGEPTLRPDLPAILRHLGRYPQLYALLFSNMRRGYPQDAVEAFFGAGLASARLLVSLDTLKTPNLRGVDSAAVLARAERALAEARRQDRPGRRCRVGIHTVVSRENLDDLTSLHETFASRGLESSMGLVCAVTVTDEPKAWNEYSREELRQVERAFVALEADGNLVGASRLQLEHLRLLTGGTPPLDEPCLAGREHIMVEPDGEVMPCLTACTQAGLRYGNVRENDFATIYERMKTFRCPIDTGGTCFDHFRWNRYVHHFEAYDEEAL